MRINSYQVLPRIAALLSVSWLGMILGVLINGYRIPVALHSAVIGWFIASLVSIGIYIALVTHLGPGEYTARSRPE